MDIADTSCYSSRIHDKVLRNLHAFKENEISFSWVSNYRHLCVGHLQEGAALITCMDPELLVFGCFRSHVAFNCRYFIIALCLDCILLVAVCVMVYTIGRYVIK